METLSRSSVRRSLNVTPFKLPLAKKLVTETEPSPADILATISSLDNKVDFGNQLKDNTDMLTSGIQRVDPNSVEITECRSTTEVMEKEHSGHKKENAKLKEKILKVVRNKQRWN